MGITKGLSLILPAYNEAEALPLLVYEINETLHSLDHLEVIIVNDGSQDETSNVMHALVEEHRQGKLKSIHHI